MEVDASDSAMKEILSMECKDRRWKPVAFLLKSLHETKRNYGIHDKEMLVVIRGPENWRYLLEGTKFKFEVWTDHKFNFILKYVPDIKMRKADGLSRQLDWKVGVENGNNNQTLIKEQWIHNLSKVVIEGLEIDIIEKLKIARNKNEEVVKVVEEMKKVGVKVLREDEW